MSSTMLPWCEMAATVTITITPTMAIHPHTPLRNPSPANRLPIGEGMASL